MRILHLVHQYPPEFIGGTELYTQSLAHAQAGMGHQVTVFYPSPSAAQDDGPVTVDAQEVRIVTGPLGEGEMVSRTRVFLNTFRAPRLAEAFSQVLEKEKPDLIHIQHLMGLPVRLVEHIREAGIPYVVTLHDYWFPCANAQLLTNYDQSICAGPRAWVNCGRCALARAGRDSRLFAPALAPLLGLRARLLRPVLEEAAKVIAPTLFVQQKMAELGWPAGNVVVVPHGIALPPNLPQRTQPHRPGTLHIAYVGGIAPQKGVHVLVEAVNSLPDEGFTLTLYGDLQTYPAYAEGLQQMAARPGLRFAGRVEREEVWAGLVNADVLAVPSLWYETAALVIQEGFAAGVPVLAADLGALRERVRHGEDGLLLPAGEVSAWREALVRLRDEPGLWERLRAGIRPVRTIGDHVAEIMHIYAAVSGS